MFPALLVHLIVLRLANNAQDSHELAFLNARILSR